MKGQQVVLSHNVITPDTRMSTISKCVGRSSVMGREQCRRGEVKELGVARCLVLGQKEEQFVYSSSEDSSDACFSWRSVAAMVLL